MTKSVELREKRANITKLAREITDKAKNDKGEPRDLTAEENAAFDAHMVDVDKIGQQVERIERLERAEADADAPGTRRNAPLDTATASHEERALEAAGRHRHSFRSWMMSGEMDSELRADQAKRAPEYRDTVISTDSKGGYLITPVEISKDILTPLNNQVFIRDLCAAAGSIMKVKEAKKLGIRQRVTRMSDADWTTEVQAVIEDTTGAYGRRDLEPQLVAKLALISLRTLMLAIDAEKELTDEIAYKMGVTQENAFLNGSGSGRPLGIFTLDSGGNGVLSSSDVPTAAPTAISGDDLINVKFALKPQYWSSKSIAWVMHPLIVKAIRQLKVSAAGLADALQYVWQPGLTSGAPDTLLDIPLKMSLYAPSTVTAGLYTAILGDFKYYRIAELPDVMLQRLTERYADTNQVGFIARHWVDGSCILSEAFSRMIQHA